MSPQKKKQLSIIESPKSAPKGIGHTHYGGFTASSNQAAAVQTTTPGPEPVSERKIEEAEEDNISETKRGF